MDSKFTIPENTSVKNVMKILNVQRINKQFCDLTIKSNDGETFLVHKIVICASSSFFEALFDLNFPDKESDVIQLSKIPSDVLKILIEFMYGEKITIQVKEICNVLDGALFLGLYNLVDSCTQVLMKTVNKTNKFELLNYAETYINIHGEKLAKECLKFILNDCDFQAIIKSEDFLHLSFYTIKILVSIERNESFNEENLFLSLIEWISFNIVNREQYISSMINQIHFDKISNAFLSTIYENYDNLRSNVDFVQKMLETTSFLNCNCNKTKSLSLQKDETKKLNLSSIIGNIYGVFGDKMFMLDTYRMDFLKIIATIDRAYFGYTNYKNQGIFLCGGKINENGTVTKSCKYFSFHTNQFHELLPMQSARSYHRAVTLNDQIYVCGDGDCNNSSMEIYDLNTNCWRNECKLNKGYSDFGLCTLDGSIYTITSNYLERFDPRESRWTILSESDYEGYYACAAVAYKNFIYKFDEFGCRKFDIRQNEWINDAIKNVDYRIQHVCAVDNEIYALDSDKNLLHLNCENDSIIKIYEPPKTDYKGFPYALLFV